MLDRVQADVDDHALTSESEVTRWHPTSCSGDQRTDDGEQEGEIDSADSKGDERYQRRYMRWVSEEADLDVLRRGDVHHEGEDQGHQCAEKKGIDRRVEAW